jgi:hypothetical protein
MEKLRENKERCYYEFNRKKQSKDLAIRKATNNFLSTHAHMLSVSLLNKEALIWFYEYYIQLFARKDISKYCFVDFVHPYHGSHVLGFIFKESIENSL